MGIEVVADDQMHRVVMFEKFRRADRVEFCDLWSV